jgi:hypothetical protein
MEHRRQRRAMYRKPVGLRRRWASNLVLMTFDKACDGRIILEDERTWAKGRQSSMSATRPGKRAHAMLEHRCAWTQAVHERIQGLSGGKYLPQRLETNGQTERSLTCSKQMSHVGRRLEALAPKRFSWCSCTCLAATLPEEETTSLVLLCRSQRGYTTRCLSTLRGALHGENQFWCADIMPSAMMPCSQVREGGQRRGSCMRRTMEGCSTRWRRVPEAGHDARMAASAKTACLTLKIQTDSLTIVLPASAWASSTKPCRWV